MKQEVVAVGFDPAKNAFQVHAIGADGDVLVRRKRRRTKVVGFFAEPGRPGVGKTQAVHAITSEECPDGSELLATVGRCH